MIQMVVVYEETERHFNSFWEMEQDAVRINKEEGEMYTLSLWRVGWTG